MGGSNTPTLNSLLNTYHISFGQGIYSGDFEVQNHKIEISSGSEIVRFPKNGYLISAELKSQAGGESGNVNTPTIGITHGLPGLKNSGNIIVMTDSDCLSAQKLTRPCYGIFLEFVQIATGNSSSLINEIY